MITEALLDMIKGTILFIIGLLPTMDSLQIPTGFMTWFTDIMTSAGYFLPLMDFLIMMSIWFMIVNFHIIWNTIQRIWDALPFT